MFESAQNWCPNGTCILSVREEQCAYLINPEGNLLGWELDERADEGDADVSLHDPLLAAGPADDGVA